MPQVTPCLWFDGQAEAAATLYTSLFPDSRIDHVQRAPGDTPSGTEGSVLMVMFTLEGRAFTGLNGGPQFPFTEAVSFQVDCADQAEADRYWNALTADGGTPGQCGWLKDRFGVSWQVVPRELRSLLGGSDPDGARRALEAMLTMSRIDMAAVQAAYNGTGV